MHSELRARVSAGTQGIESGRWAVAAVALKAPQAHLSEARYLLDLNDPEGELPEGSDVDFGFVLDSLEVEEIECVVVESALLQEGHVSIVMDGPAVDLLKVQFLQLLVRGSRAGDWRLFKDESSREAWLKASLYYAHLLTPWTGMGDSDPGGVIDGSDVPTAIEVHIRPTDFDSRAALFCYLGEAFLGPGGYMGQDLDGLGELVGALSAASVSMSVTFHNVDELREKALEFSGRTDYIDVLLDVFRTGGAEVIIDTSS